MKDSKEYRSSVSKHYAIQAEKECHQDTSTMPDLRVRELENIAIDKFLINLSKDCSILEISCGNGLNLSRISKDKEFQNKLPVRNTVFVEFLNILSNPLMKMNISPIRIFCYKKKQEN